MSLIEERAERARRGSKRKRDVDALAELTARAELPIEAVDHWQTWAQVVALTAEDVPASTFELWLLPIEPIGERAGAVVLTADRRVVEWVVRRYFARIEQAIADLTGLRTELLSDTPDPERTA